MQFKQKYQKYLYKLKNLIGGEPKYITIPKETLWFRTAPEICKYKTSVLCMANAQVCTDTHKKGIYIANRVLYSLSICLEYDKLLELGVFVLTEDIKVLDGKYEYREINPDRYFDKDKNLKPNVEPLDNENISHRMCNTILLSMNKAKNGIEKLFPDKYFDRNRDMCELFLSKDDIKKIRLKATYKFNPEKISSADNLREYIEANDYPDNIQKYIDDNILIKHEC